jgi:hypothetical protein
MKALLMSALLIIIIGNIGAVDIESYQFIDYLRAVSAPGKPVIFENGVVFTAPSSFQRVGISFAHENYGKVHWFRRLMVPRDPAELAEADRNRRNIDPNIDSGIMFHMEIIPPNLSNMDYRLVIDGLWTADPLNPMTVRGPTGILESRVPLPVSSGRLHTALETPPGSYRFNFRASPGEIVTVGGSFNNWDPFMYELREISPGFYTTSIPLPPGTYQYVFFHRGERIPDPANPRRLYSRDGRIVSEARHL